MKTSPFVILCLTGSINARLSKGKCSDLKVPAFQNVDIEKVEGDWYPLYTDNQTKAMGYDVSCLKAKAKLAQKWWEEYDEGAWDSAEGEWSSSDSSDSDDAGEEEGEKDAGAEGDKQEGEKDAGAEGEKDAGAPADEKKKAKGEKDAGAASDDKKKKKSAKKAGKEDREVGMPSEGTARLYNSAVQVKDGAQVFGMQWTVDVQTQGDAKGTGYVFGKEVGTGTLVDIDYDGHIIAHMCEQISEDMKAEAWGINVRNPDLSAEEKQAIWNKANELLKQANQSSEEFLKVEGKVEENEEERQIYEFEKDLMEVKQGNENQIMETKTEQFSQMQLTQMESGVNRNSLYWVKVKLNLNLKRLF